MDPQNPYLPPEGEPDEGDQPQPTAEERLEALASDFERFRVDQEQRQRFYQQTIDQLISRPQQPAEPQAQQPQQQTPQRPRMPDPTDDPEGWRQWLEQRDQEQQRQMAQLVGQAGQSAQQLAAAYQADRARDRSWATFEAEFEDVADNPALIRGVTEQVLDERQQQYRGQLDRSQIIAADPDGFAREVGQRLRQLQPGEEPSPEPTSGERRRGASLGIPSGRSSKSSRGGGEKPLSLAEQVIAYQKHAGLI